MIRFPLIAVLLLLPLAGCLGVPEGSAGVGDQVAVVVTVSDAATGETLMEDRPLDFRVASGASGLGFTFERALIGRSAGETLTITVRDDRSLAFNQVVERPAFFDPAPLDGSATQEQWVQNFGAEAVAGEEYDIGGFYPYRVEAVQGDQVQFRLLAVDGQRDEVPSLGVTVITHVDEGAGTYQLEFEPEVGAVFIIQPSQFFPTFQGLEPGSYKHLGRDGDTLRYGHNPSSTPDLLGRDLHITAELQSVTQAGAAPVEPVDGNYGVRNSAQVNGVPNATPQFGPFVAASG